ncbi:ThuA domain-containing protein [Aureibaculum luteum]|uniref:ThuA domain-containing protein n=1 Tax=Aureibaculum luteum TaxID=1548456 RepID=UPI000E4F6E22|nr:ThuA domain-containing protein [Aureibaculum luteum]
MKSKLISLSVVCVLMLITPCLQAQSENLLIFSKTEGYRHKSIETGIVAIKKLAKENDFNVTATEDATYFNADTLKNYKAVLFLSTTGNILNEEQQDSFKKFIQSGGGFVGIHAATDTEFDWPWYGKLVGAYFASHPKQQQATVTIIDYKHMATKMLPKKWSLFDEWYNFKDISEDIDVLANLDETSYTGGENGSHHPISWVQEYDGGKMFYTGMGHTNEAFADTDFLAHVLGGIQYVFDRSKE